MMGPPGLGFSDCMNTIIRHSSRRLCSKTPTTREKRNQRIIDRPSSSVVVFFAVQKQCDGSCFFLSFVSLSFMQHASNCVTVLVRLFIEWADWSVFSLGRPPRICEAAMLEPSKNEVCVYFELLWILNWLMREAIQLTWRFEWTRK